MTTSTTLQPDLFGILHRHLAGDVALLRLAQAKLERAGMGGEIYPANVDDALTELHYAPSSVRRHVLHLPRHWDVFAAADRQNILAFARVLPDRLRGMVLHDRRDWPARAGELAAALAEVDLVLAALPGSPMLFLEYAAGLALDDYAALIERLAPLPRIGACIDTGHVSIFASQRWLTSRHPGLDPRRLDPQDSGTAALAADLAEAAAVARRELVGLVDRIARLGKPTHFHLHDGHLLSRLSRYGVSDHLPFGERVPVATTFAAEGSVSAMLGEAGLRDVLAAVRSHVPAAQVSLTLEIHPNLRLSASPLGEWAPLFTHWTDLANAELMSGWLDQVTLQAALVRRLW